MNLKLSLVCVPRARYPPCGSRREGGGRSAAGGVRRRTRPGRDELEEIAAARRGRVLPEAGPPEAQARTLRAGPPERTGDGATRGDPSAAALLGGAPAADPGGRRPAGGADPGAAAAHPDRAA